MAHLAKCLLDKHWDLSLDPWHPHKTPKHKARVSSATKRVDSSWDVWSSDPGTHDGLPTALTARDLHTSDRIICFSEISCLQKVRCGVIKDINLWVLYVCNEHTCAHEEMCINMNIQREKNNTVQDADFPAAFSLRTPNSLVNDTL